MSLIRIVPELKTDNSSNREVDGTISSLKERGHGVETFHDSQARGITADAIIRPFDARLYSERSPTDPPLEPAEILVEIADVYERDRNAGLVHTAQISRFAESHPDKLFLIVNLCPLGLEVAETIPTKNLFFWNLNKPLSFAMFDPWALHRVIDAWNEDRHSRTESIEERKIEIQRIESKAAVFVDSAIEVLQKREILNRWLSIFWYVAGLIGFLLGTVELLRYGPAAAAIDTPSILLAFTKTIGIISIMAVAVKYCADLGKAFMRESLRNADRVHAINFGKFYISAYGDTATWSEIKEAFAQWNIDQPTAFADIKGDYDPKSLEILASLAKAITKKTEG